MFPNLFIIGAMKAGTSSLHEYLHQHPEIFMSRMKEPQYFAPHATRWGQLWGQGNPWPEPGIDWYLKLFDEVGSVAYAGESSVSYSARPWVEDCEERIFQFNPKSRIIYLMRDPIERAISHYWYFVQDGREDRDMLTAFRRKPEYVARSNYLMQLTPYLKRFGAERVYTLTSEELSQRPDSTLKALFEWLGVDPHVPIDVSRRFNVSSPDIVQTRRHRVPFDTAMKHWRWKRVEHAIPKAAIRVLEKFTYRKVDKRSVAVSGAVRFLRPILEEHTRRLTDELRRDFPEWTTLYSV